MATENQMITDKTLSWQHWIAILLASGFETTALLISTKVAKYQREY